MAGLVLQPTMDDTTREEYEAWLDTVRSRRLLAAVEHAQGVKLRLDREADLAQKRLGQALDQLGKKLLQMEALDEKISELLIKVEGYRQEIGFIEENTARGLMKPEDDDGDE